MSTQTTEDPTPGHSGEIIKARQDQIPFLRQEITRLTNNNKIESQTLATQVEITRY